MELNSTFRVTGEVGIFYKKNTLYIANCCIQIRRNSVLGNVITRQMAAEAVWNGSYQSMIKIFELSVVIV